MLRAILIIISMIICLDSLHLSMGWKGRHRFTLRQATALAGCWLGLHLIQA